MNKWRYRYQGATVLSDLEVPEWEPFADAGDSSEFDVSVRVEPRSAGEEEPAQTAREHRFYEKAAGWFRVRNGREIIVTPCERFLPEQLRAFLLGSAWGALMYQRGQLIIHASAVRSGNGGVAFCAACGGGKSTLAAALISRGYPFLSDDLCYVETVNSGPPVAHPSTFRLKLWEEAFHQLGRKVPESVSDQIQPGKFQCLPDARERAPLALRGVYLLSWGQLGIDRVTGLAALQRFLTAATWRGRLLFSTGDPGVYFQQCADVLRTVPVWEFRRPRELSTLDESATILERHLRDQLL